jgi:hypothetical protein
MSFRSFGFRSYPFPASDPGVPTEPVNPTEADTFLPWSRRSTASLPAIESRDAEQIVIQLEEMLADCRQAEAMERLAGDPLDDVFHELIGAKPRRCHRHR